MKSEMDGDYCQMFNVHIFQVLSYQRLAIVTSLSDTDFTGSLHLQTRKDTFSELKKSYACICDSIVLFSHSDSVVEILSITEFTCKNDTLIWQTFHKRNGSATSNDYYIQKNT